MSYALINEGKIVYYRVLGYADKEKQIKADENTIWEAASISKSVFAYFVMKFVEEGKLDLDKPLYQYLPYPDIAYDDRYKKITARMVLSHRSGFPNWRFESGADKLFIQFEPGSDYFYSGEGYQYLAMVLKHISKTNWAGLEEIFQEKVARPLGMQHSRFIADDYIRKHKAKAYDDQGNWIDKLAIDWWKKNDTVFVAPTTLMTEPQDFSKWVRAIIKEEGLKKATFQEMLKTHSRISESFLGEEKYALGFFNMSLPFGEFYAHSGNNTGYTSIYALNQEKKWATIEFNNADRGALMGYETSLFMLTGYKLEKYMAGGLFLVWTVVSLFITSLFYFFGKK
ncbi:MAG: serine hydrolase domain-containing protein, partial [Bacteroidota bacterium]